MGPSRQPGAGLCGPGARRQGGGVLDPQAEDEVEGVELGPLGLLDAGGGPARSLARRVVRLQVAGEQLGGEDPHGGGGGLRG